MGRYGLRSGYGEFQNMQSALKDITVDSNGDGTTSVTFLKAMKSVPVVIMTTQEADITGTLTATSVSTTGFTATVDGSAVTGDSLTVGWFAHDQTPR